MHHTFIDRTPENALWWKLDYATNSCASNALGSVPNTQLFHYERASWFGDSGCRYDEGFYECYFKVDGGILGDPISSYLR